MTQMYQTFRQIQQYFNICFWYLWSKRVPCAHFLLPATCRIHVNMQYWESTPQRCSSPGSEIPEDKGSVQPTCLRVENEESRNSHPASPWSSNRLAPIHLRRFRPCTTNTRKSERLQLCRSLTVTNPTVILRRYLKESYWNLVDSNKRFHNHSPPM